MLAMFFVARHDASGAGYTSRFLARLLPHLSSAELRSYVWAVRKLVHLFAYGLLTVIVYLAAKKTQRLRRYALPFSIAFALVVAAADETYQTFLQHRSGAWGDVLLDGVGIFLTAGALWLRSRILELGNKEVGEDVENE